MTSAGGTSYQYSGSCLDLLGLNNAEMAMADPTKRGAMRNHGSFSRNVFFDQQPDILVVFGASTDPVAQQHFNDDWAPNGIQRLLLRGLLEDPRMQNLYVAAKVSRGRDSYYALVRKQWTVTLPEDVLIAPFQIDTAQEPDIP